MRNKKTSKTDARSRERVGVSAGQTGLFVNILLFELKLIAGLLSGSIAVAADAVNSLSDAAASIVTLMGFRMSQKPADREHPFGHARMEYLAGVFIAIAILLVGVELLRSSVVKILHPQPIAFTAASVALLVVSVVIKLLLFGFYRKTAARIGSATLKVAGDDARNDVVSSTVVIVGALVQLIFALPIDGWLGAAVSVFILVSGVRSLVETISPLLGEAPPQTLVDNLYRALLGYDGVLGVHDLILHSYGPKRYFASVHIEMDARMDPLRSHGIIDNIEHDIAQQFGVKTVVHYDPIEPADERTAALHDRIAALVKEIHPALTIHDLRLSRTHDHTNIIFDVAVPPDLKMDSADLRGRIAGGVAALDGNYRAVVEIDRNYTQPSGS